MTLRTLRKAFSRTLSKVQNIHHNATYLFEYLQDIHSKCKGNKKNESAKKKEIFCLKP